MASKAVDGDIALVRAEDLAPGDISSFLLTAALCKAKAHGKAHPWLQSSPLRKGGANRQGWGWVLKPTATHRAPACSD